MVAKGYTTLPFQSYIHSKKSYTLACMSVDRLIAAVAVIISGKGHQC